MRDKNSGRDYPGGQTSVGVGEALAIPTGMSPPDDWIALRVVAIEDGMPVVSDGRRISRVLFDQCHCFNSEAAALVWIRGRDPRRAHQSRP